MQTEQVSETKAEQRARVSRVILLLVVPRRLVCFGSSVLLDVVCGYLLFLLDIKIENW